MLIVFRLESSVNFGRGHFNRCLLLANLLKKNYQILFYFNRCNSFFKKELKKYKINFVEKNISLHKEVIFLNKLNKKFKIKAIIKDSYQLNFKWEKKINSFFNLVVIDDRLNIKHCTDLYINYNFDKKFLRKKINFKSIKNYLVGQKYFITKEKLKNVKEQDNSFFVYLGSVDSNNYSIRIINYLIKNFNNNIFCLVPQFNKSVEKKLEKIPNQKNLIIIKKNIENISFYIKKSRYIFHSAGTTIYETILYKKKPIVIPQNKHQKKLCEYLQKKDQIIYLKNINDIKKINFSKINLFKIKQTDISINGKYKIINKIINLLK